MTGGNGIEPNNMDPCSQKPEGINVMEHTVNFLHFLTANDF